jgi:uncharacterized protein (DUF1786 family)
MKILTVDVGTGTQDIFLYDSKLNIENGFKLIVPSPTMIIHHRIKDATRRGEAILLTGVTMGGGPSHWAARDHAKAGYQIYATPEAAKTFDDNLEYVADQGIIVISKDEAKSLNGSVSQIELRDFDFKGIERSFGQFGLPLDDLAATAVAVFDHGAAPPDVSDRQFRFDYLDEHIRSKNRLSAFAFPSDGIPKIMTRLQAVADSVVDQQTPLIVMDTAPAAVLGATFDPLVAGRNRVLIANVGNFHTLAFRLGTSGIEGVFEHHTGFLDLPKLHGLLRSLADGSLEHQDVFNDHGHGALVYGKEPLSFGQGDFDIVVTGPRRSMLRTAVKNRSLKAKNSSSNIVNSQGLRPYFPAPFGDMMITGCFGLLAAVADLMPELADPIRSSLTYSQDNGIAPWDVS